MAILRAFMLVFALAGFYILGTPLQWLAQKRRWPLAQRIPPFFCGTICAIIGLRINFETPPVSDGPRLIVANHVSWTDILVLASRAPICFVAKAEVAKWPIFGAFARVQRTIFVDRNNRADVPRVNKAMAARMMAGEDVLLFAEGTSSDGSGVLSFKPSHFGAARDLLRIYPQVEKVVVQPVAIAYTRAKGVLLDEAARQKFAWFGNSALLPHIWLLLKSGPVDCRVAFGAPLAFTASSERKILALATRQSVEKLARRLIEPANSASTPLMRCEEIG